MSAARSTHGECLVAILELIKQRPSAKDLLKHKFIRTARKASYLTELIEKCEKWKADGGSKPVEESARNAAAEYVGNLFEVKEC